MEETKSNSAKLSRTKQPVKTEWGAHYMVLTYFQGDTNSMVDEHFSRALSVTKNQQDLSRDNSVKDALINNENHPPSHGWGGLPTHWTKPYGAASPLNLCASDEHPIVPAMDVYQPSILQGAPSPATAELWPSSSGGDPRLTPVSGYPTSDLQMGRQDSMSDEKYNSLLGLLEQERCSRPVRELLDSRSACLTGSAGLQNMSQRNPVPPRKNPRLQLSIQLKMTTTPDFLGVSSSSSWRSPRQFSQEDLRPPFSRHRSLRDRPLLVFRIESQFRNDIQIVWRAGKLPHEGSKSQDLATSEGPEDRTLNQTLPVCKDPCSRC